MLVSRWPCHANPHDRRRGGTSGGASQLPTCVADALLSRMLRGGCGGAMPQIFFRQNRTCERFAASDIIMEQPVENNDFLHPRKRAAYQKALLLALGLSIVLNIFI